MRERQGALALRPRVYKVAGEKMRASGAPRLAFWKGKVYLGTRDGRLIAIDANRQAGMERDDGRSR